MTLRVVDQWEAGGLCLRDLCRLKGEPVERYPLLYLHIEGASVRSRGGHRMHNAFGQVFCMHQADEELAMAGDYEIGGDNEAGPDHGEREARLLHQLLAPDFLQRRVGERPEL
eukprot:CAMPEP_0114535668 /NCGR_PEP_ID=MMETSP0109-20121206/28553_1 /TAXON_ID=29199 /ORGANISM="Chlorarachnion reptans, Strain CCCM449" /LENGTH=112 /DNA_ID=CAMNT_0001719277 /DNA_START=466 /DNA_END=805 /DNA_ORIENTATION=+